MKMSGRFLLIVPCLLLAMCGKSKEQNSPAVNIGGKVISNSSFESFRKLHRMYPVRLNQYFPGTRSDVSFMVETEILYGKAGSARGKALSSGDWRWKAKFFPASLYITEVLDKNLGFSEKEIGAYFASHRNQFKGTVQVRDTVRKAVPGDSTKRDSVVTRDSLILKPLTEVRTEVVEKLFFDNNPPDTGFYSKHKSDSGKIDTAYVQRSYVYEIRNKLPDFFMRKLYQKKFGKPLVDSLKEIYGQDKIIKPADMEVILNWIPEEQRQNYSSDSSRLLFLAQWLLKWQLFSDEAARTGYSNKKDVREMLDWAKKVEAVEWYIDNTLQPKATTAAKLDSAMCVFSYWDDLGQIIQPPDSAGYANSLKKIVDQKIADEINGQVYGFRKNVRVKFLQQDWKDDFENNPAAVLKQADSARDTGDSKSAESFYQMLVRSFPFTTEGQQAFSELAKIQTENGQYRDAIQNYRHVLMSSGDQTKRCNTFFMIGFIYDEYLDKPDMAEVNYRWVLRNTPECDLSDDAEFMVLHLDEPMTSVEELRDEALRQGRKIDDDTTAVEKDTGKVALQ